VVLRVISGFWDVRGEGAAVPAAVHVEGSEMYLVSCPSTLKRQHGCSQWRGSSSLQRPGDSPWIIHHFSRGTVQPYPKGHVGDRQR